MRRLAAFLLAAAVALPAFAQWGPSYSTRPISAFDLLTVPLGPASGGSGVANNAANTLTWVGSYAATFTLTNTTGVTFPTAGTLATLAGSETLTNKTLTAPVISTISNSGTVTVPTGTVTLATTAQVPAAGYTSTAQTITAAGALTLAHGQAATPNLFAIRLKNVTGECGYTATNEVLVSPGNQVAVSLLNANEGVSIVPDATNLNIRFGSSSATFSVNNKGDGSGCTITNANWTIIFRAWVLP